MQQQRGGHEDREGGVILQIGDVAAASYNNNIIIKYCCNNFGLDWMLCTVTLNKAPAASGSHRTYEPWVISRNRNRNQSRPVQVYYTYYITHFHQVPD